LLFSVHLVITSLRGTKQSHSR